MLNYQPQYETHPLYQHFKSWVDMEINYDESYYIMNTALYAAEEYILSNYNVTVNPISVREYFGDSTGDTLYPRLNISSILASYTDNGYEIPAISYFSETDGVYVNSDGPYKVDDNSLIDVTANNLHIEYLSGYVYPPVASSTSVIPSGNIEEGISVTRPSIFNENGSPLASPAATINEFYNLKIVADAGATIFVNGVEAELRDAQGILISSSLDIGPVVNEERTGLITLTLATGLNTVTIDARDNAGGISDAIVLLFNRQDAFNDTSVGLISKDLVTNTGLCKLIISALPGSVIQVNGTSEIAYSTGINALYATVYNAGVNTLEVVVTHPSGVVSETLKTHILFDDTLEDTHVSAINSIYPNVPVLPQDLLMAILMIANHYFRIALYKHEDTASYGDNVSNRTTFNTDRFPKEAHRILSRYVMY